MTPEDALRWLEHESDYWRNHRDATRDEVEMFALNLPALLKVFNLRGMTDLEAAHFRVEFHDRLKEFRFDPKPTRVGCNGST